MVSLMRSPNRSGGGAFSFTDGSINVDEDEIRILQPVIGEDADSLPFHPLKTVPIVLLQLFFTVAFGVIAIGVGFLWPKERERCEPFYLLLYMQAIFWFITLVIYLYVRSRHHRLRVAGYLDFYSDMLVLYRLPVHIACLSSVLLLVVATVMHQTYQPLEMQCQPLSRLFTPVIYIGAMVLVETIVLCPCLISYIVRVRRFNRVQPPPDVQREEWLASLVDETYRRAEIGFRESREQTEELLERQADLIRYLREHNAHLGLKVVQLSARLNGDQD